MRISSNKFVAPTIYLIVFLVLAVATTIMVWQVGYAPDQGAHHLLVQNFFTHLFSNGRDLWTGGAERGHAYNLFSPVPYAVNALSGYLFRDYAFDACRRCDLVSYRLGGLVYCLLQLVVFALFAREVAGRGSHAVCFGCALALVPQLTVLHAYVNADSYSILVSSICVLVGLRMYVRRGPAIRSLWGYLLLGLLVVALLHSKDSAYPMAFPLLLGGMARLVRAMRRRVVSPSIGRGLLLIFLVAAIGGGSYRLKVYKELGNGDVFAGMTHLELMRSTFQGKGSFDYMHFSPSIDKSKMTSSYSGAFFAGWDRLMQYLEYTWQSAWGDLFLIGSLPSWMLQAIAGLSVISVIGWIGLLCLTFARARLIRLRRYRMFGRRFGVYVTVSLAVCLVGTLIPLILQDVVIQGRLLMTTLPLYGVVLIYGLAIYFKLLGLGRKNALLCASFCWGVMFATGNFYLVSFLI